MLGGTDIPGVGAAAGVERIVASMKERKSDKGIEEPRVFLAQLGDLPKKKSIKLMEEFRRAKIDVAESLGRDSLRTQLARADKLQVEFSLILGGGERVDSRIVIRREAEGEPKPVKSDKVIEEIRTHLKR